MVYVNFRHKPLGIEPEGKTIGPFDFVYTTYESDINVNGVIGIFDTQVAVFDRTTHLWSVGHPKAGGSRPTWRHIHISDNPDQEPDYVPQS